MLLRVAALREIGGCEIPRLSYTVFENIGFSICVGR
jgi:hypothetical protein